VRTLIGRIRYIPEFNSSEPQARQFAERIAINTPLQGTAAEIIKIAMIKLDGELKKNNIDADIVLQVHDELLLEMAKKDVKDACVIIKQVMENVIPLSVPLRVDIRVGKNWLEMEKP
jgi:DNA polymerase-1